MVCEAAPISFFWPPNGLNELLEVRLKVPFILIGKSTMSFSKGQSWHVLKCWYISGHPEQGLRRCFTDGLNQLVHEPRPPKVIFVAPPLGPSYFGTKLKLIDHILWIHLLPGWQLARSGDKRAFFSGGRVGSIFVLWTSVLLKNK